MFENFDLTSDNDALTATTNGTGNALGAINYGYGSVLELQVTNTGNSSDALTISTVGGGVGVFSHANGAAGVHAIGNPGIYVEARGLPYMAGIFDGNVDISDACTAAAFYETSDARFKSDVRPIENALESALELRGVTYEMNNDRGTTTDAPARDIGFIAQEVRSVLPEVVYQKNDGFLSVSYTRIVPILIEALKEQQIQIEMLEERLARLEGFVR